MNPDALLTLSGVHTHIGAYHILHGVDLVVPKGQVSLLLGRNGAGKSTMLHAIGGLIPKRGGRVHFDGRDISVASARDIVRAGIVQVLEGHRVFTTLSVEDNLLLGTYARHPRGDRSGLERIYTLFPEVADRRHQLASRLSGGQQQILAVAQGVIGEPRLLVLDEPSAGLAPLVIDRILDVAAQLCRQGLAILLVEQLVDKALNHAHFAYLVETGAIAGHGFAHEILGSDALHRAYLGHEAGAGASSEPSHARP